MGNRMSRMTPNKLYNYSYQYNDKLPIGKHKGKIIGNIAETEPSYILWLSNKKLVRFSLGIMNLVNRRLKEIEDEKIASSWSLGEEDDYLTEDIYGRND